MTPYGEDGYLMFQGGNVLLSTDGTWTSTAHDAVDGLNWGVTNIYSTSDDIATNRAASHMFGMLKSESRTEEKRKLSQNSWSLFVLTRLNGLKLDKSLPVKMF